LQKFPDAVIHGDAEHRLGNTLNLRIPGVSGESALINLDMAGVAVSIGAACDSGSIEPSHVLRAMGVPRGEAMNGLRFSLSRYNTAAEIEKVLEIVPQVVERIRRVA
jgi:cysteine desulfurase